MAVPRRLLGLIALLWILGGLPARADCCCHEDAAICCCVHDCGCQLEQAPPLQLQSGWERFPFELVLTGQILPPPVPGREFRHSSACQSPAERRYPPPVPPPRPLASV